MSVFGTNQYNTYVTQPQFISALQDIHNTSNSSGGFVQLNTQGKIDTNLLPVIPLQNLPTIVFENVTVCNTILDRGNLNSNAGDLCKVLSNNLWYVYNGSDWLLITSPIPSLEALQDSHITNIQNGEYLKYNSVNGLWENHIITEGDVLNLTSDLGTINTNKENIANKNIAYGYCPLDSNVIG